MNAKPVELQSIPTNAEPVGPELTPEDRIRSAFEGRVINSVARAKHVIGSNSADVTKNGR